MEKIPWTEWGQFLPILPPLQDLQLSLHAVLRGSSLAQKQHSRGTFWAVAQWRRWGIPTLHLEIPCACRNYQWIQASVLQQRTKIKRRIGPKRQLSQNRTQEINRREYELQQFKQSSQSYCRTNNQRHQNTNSKSCRRKTVEEEDQLRFLQKKINIRVYLQHAPVGRWRSMPHSSWESFLL